LGHECCPPALHVLFLLFGTFAHHFDESFLLLQSLQLLIEEDLIANHVVLAFVCDLENLAGPLKGPTRQERSLAPRQCCLRVKPLAAWGTPPEADEEPRPTLRNIRLALAI